MWVPCRGGFQTRPYSVIVRIALYAINRNTSLSLGLSGCLTSASKYAPRSTLEEANAWLEKLEAGEDAEPPKCHK